MRHEKAQNLLLLALEMQGSSEGVSLKGIQDRFRVSRRTAERMRDAVLAVFPQIEEYDAGDGYKRWHIKSGNAVSSIPVSPDEVAALNSAMTVARQQGLEEQARNIESASAKLRSMIRPKDLPKLEPDIEALVQAEGLASRPGPRPNIDPAVLAELRYAIKACKVVTLNYRARGTGATSYDLPVHPYGFLYGSRHYLVAYNPYEYAQGYRLFSLSNIESAEVSGEGFIRDSAFDIRAYADRSFGVYQEETHDVVWRVLPEAADQARDFVFHPTQVMEEQPDGSLIIRFTAGGLREMCWHLVTWEGNIQILEPESLVREMEVLIKKVGGILRSPSNPSCVNAVQEAE